MVNLEYKGVILFISTKGDVFNKNMVKKKTYVDKQGYERVGIWLPEQKTEVVRVHQLMGIAYFDKDYVTKGLVVNHKDLNKSNNSLENLEVVTESLNAIHATIGGKCSLTKFHGVVGLSGNESLFVWRLRDLKKYGFCRKRVAQSVKTGVEYNNFQWFTLEDFKNAHD